MPLNPVSWWTPLSTPRPPDELIEGAAKDIPTALSDGERRDDLNGEYYQETKLLFLAIEQAGHSRNVIAWALNEMIQRGLVSAVSFSKEEKDRVVTPAHKGICSTGRLWEWWRNGSSLLGVGKAGHGKEANLDATLTLEEAAHLVHKSKSGLRNYKSKGLPKPCQEGKPFRYMWSEMRDFLEKQFKAQLPEVMPRKKSSE